MKTSNITEEEMHDEFIKQFAHKFKKMFKKESGKKFAEYQYAFFRDICCESCYDCIGCDFRWLKPPLSQLIRQKFEDDCDEDEEND